MDLTDDDVDDLDLDEPGEAAPPERRACHVCERDLSAVPRAAACPYCGSGSCWFRCRNCGQTCLRFSRRCPFCRQVNCLYRVENVSRVVKTAVQSMADMPAHPTPRIATNVAPFDKLVGGGLAIGSVTLVWGDPGTGKSTFLLQVCGACGVDVLYISGEEPLDQLMSRALRLGMAKAPNVKLMRSQTTEEVITALCELQPRIVIVDSVQAFHSDTVDGMEGGHAQVRHLVNEIVRSIKGLPCAVVLVGQVTADGRAAGPARMRHWVDTLAVMRMVPNREKLRSLYAPKNRFGPARFLIPLEMTEQGLVEVESLPPAEKEKSGRSRISKGRKSPFPF